MNRIGELKPPCVKVCLKKIREFETENQKQQNEKKSFKALLLRRLYSWMDF